MTLEEYESNDLMAENEFLRKQLAEALKHRRMFEADYENRLKADLKAILVDLQLEIREHDPGCGWDGYADKNVIDCIIQQRINSLKVEGEPQESEGNMKSLSQNIIEHAKRLYPKALSYKGNLTDVQFYEIEKQCDIDFYKLASQDIRYTIRYKAESEK